MRADPAFYRNANSRGVSTICEKDRERENERTTGGWQTEKERNGRNERERKGRNYEQTNYPTEHPKKIRTGKRERERERERERKRGEKYELKKILSGWIGTYSGW